MRIIATLLIPAFVIAQSVTKSIALLPDTGQTASYTTTFGEDHDYTINTPNYTDNGDGTITDNITGLMWQKTDGGEMTIENASTYCANLSLGNYTDWRLPSPIEAYSIMIQQNANPAINTLFFPNTTAEYWWTNTFQVGDNTKVWVTNSGGGIGNHPKSETISAGGTKKFHTRAVRDMHPPILITHFTDNGDGTITDQLTQLIWQKTPSATAMTWEQALGYAENLVLANASDWRLPNIKELQSLNDESLTNPSVSTAFFPTIGVKNYWSSTTLKPNSANPLSAWFLHTQFGVTSYDVKSNQNYVLAVRGIPTALSTANFSVAVGVLSNPFHSKITLTHTTGREFYTLFSLDGRMLFSGQAIENKDFSDLTTGTYILQIIDQTTSTFKVIKQN